jgi:hypothetical protein
MTTMTRISANPSEATAVPTDASAKAARQRAADRAHHRARVAWLEGDDPRWMDGVPVDAAARTEMLRASRHYLATGEGFNHCHCVPHCGN